MTNTTAPATATTVCYLATKAGHGAWVRVEVAPTPEADAAAARFFRRACHYEVGMMDYAVANVDEEGTTHLGAELEAYFFPTCEHGMSLQLCMGPDHFPSAEQERMLWG